MKESYEIRIMDSVVIRCYKNETLLHALSRQNIGGITFGCFGGGCGQCKVEVLSGDYDAFKKMSKTHIDVVSNEKLLACCIKPKSDLVIRLLSS